MQALAGAVMLALLSGIGVAAAPESVPWQAGQTATNGAGREPALNAAQSRNSASRPGDDRTGGQPFAAGTAALGQAWPDGYGTNELPAYIIAHYGLGSDDWRMANGTVYRIDPQTKAIIAIVALVTGDTFTIGDAAPAGYDIYNLPVAYRDRWQDGPDALYRYADGRIYRIDPQTRKVAAAMDIPAIPSS